MNRIARTVAHLTVATGLAVGVVALGAGTAHADGPNGPGDFQIGPIVDPEPQPEPDPQFDGLGEITDKPNCTHGCGGEDAPTDKVAPAPVEDPADDAPLDQGCFTGCDLPEEPTVEAAPAADEPAVAPEAVQPALDARFQVTGPSDLVVAEPVTADESSQTVWYAAGGSLLALFLVAAAAIRRRRAHQA